MAYYTPPTGNDTEGIFEYFNYINVAAGGIFFPVILFVVWIVSFFAMKQYSTPRAWTFASFFCSVLSIILATLDYISPKIMYVFFILLVVGLVWLKLDRE